jgi:hypothetical protein
MSGQVARDLERLRVTLNAAIRFIDASPCDPDITDEQCEALKVWHPLRKEYEKATAAAGGEGHEIGDRIEVKAGPATASERQNAGESDSPVAPATSIATERELETLRAQVIDSDEATTRAIAKLTKELAEANKHLAEDRELEERLRGERDEATAEVERLTVANEKHVERVDRARDKTNRLKALIRRSQEWLGDDVQRRVPDFLEQVRLQADIADELGECMTDGCSAKQSCQDHLSQTSRHHRCRLHAPPGTLQDEPNQLGVTDGK